MDQTVERSRLYGLFGDLPDRGRSIAATTLGEEDRGDYILETLLLDLNGVEAVPAYFTRPKGGSAPYPTVLFSHSHGGFYDSGKREYLQGQEYMVGPPYAQYLASRGWAGLCIDHWVFGERRGRTEGEAFRLFLWQGSSLWGMMVYDSLKALEYLRARPDVDSRAIVALGMSMGATMSTWVTALDREVKACVDLFGQTEGEALIEARGLELHGLYYYLPGFLKHFGMAALDGLITPRPHLAIVGDFDKLTPPAGLDSIDRDVSRIYAESGAAGAWKMLRYPIAHYETVQTRHAVGEFLDSIKQR